MAIKQLYMSLLIESSFIYIHEHIDSMIISISMTYFLSSDSYEYPSKNFFEISFLKILYKQNLDIR